MSLRSGPWIEPAALWSAAYPDVEDLGPGDVTVRFNREHFRNGSRWPIVIKRVAMCGINYPFARVSEDFTSDSRGLGSDDVLYQGRLKIGFPFRKNFSRSTIALSGYAPKPTGQPGGATQAMSSLWGANYLRFDEPLILPRKSGVEMALTRVSNITAPFASVGQSNFGLRDGYVYYHEKGGLFSGSARLKKLQIISDSAGLFPVPDPYALIPYPIPSGYGSFAGEAFSPPLWSPGSTMTAREFEQQEATRSGSTEVYGMGVMIDQISNDDDVIQDMTGGAENGSQLAQISTRIGIRVRAVHSPVGNWWWRPGAPLALVLDTMTPALVYELPDPITLAPGDVLTAGLELPGGTDSAGPQGWQVGLSFNGYTVIEG